MTKMRISSKTGTNSLGAAIAGTLEDDGILALSCIGAMATTTAIKGCAVASNLLQRDHPDKCVHVLPAFGSTYIAGNVTTIELTVTMGEVMLEDAEN